LNVQGITSNYSNRLRPEKYQEMQALLECMAGDETSQLSPEYRQSAKTLLQGMERPKGTEQRAQERAQELRALAWAYAALKGLGAPGTEMYQAATICFEALKAWEREHPPSPLDPLLL
jgi:hypothetical protein